jgi:hypothetical protein
MSGCLLLSITTVTIATSCRTFSVLVMATRQRVAANGKYDRIEIIEKTISGTDRIRLILTIIGGIWWI